MWYIHIYHTYMCALCVDASIPAYTVFLYTFIHTHILCTHARAYSPCAYIYAVHTHVHRCVHMYIHGHIACTHICTCVCACTWKCVRTVCGMFGAASPAPFTCTQNIPIPGIRLMDWQALQRLWTCLLSPLRNHCQAPFLVPSLPMRRDLKIEENTFKLSKRIVGRAGTLLYRISELQPHHSSSTMNFHQHPSGCISQKTPVRRQASVPLLCAWGCKEDMIGEGQGS